MNAAPPPSATADAAELRALYLDLLKRSLTRSLSVENVARFQFAVGSKKRRLWDPVRRFLARHRLELVRIEPMDPKLREEGRDWPFDAETMIGLKRLTNVQECVEHCLRNGVPGDLIETGVWRGGTTIFMRAILRAWGDPSRRVWVADSFEGLPPPDAEKYPADRGDMHHAFDQLAVSMEQVRANFERYGLLDERVKFLKGWFKDTLPVAPIEKLAVMRLDGDMYESTMDALEALYPRLSPGGFAIIDDYNAVEGCKRAVTDFRERHGIREPLRDIDWAGVFWQRER